MREAFRLAVDDEVDVALAPASHGFASVAIGRRESQRLQHVTELTGFFLVGTELDELDPLALQRGGPRCCMTCSSKYVSERMPVDCNVRRRPGEEAVVENLEREHALIADFPQRRHVLHQRQVALPRHATEMTAPRQRVHR